MSLVDQRSRQRAARVAGALLLLALVTAALNQFGVRAALVVPGDAAETAARLASAEALFRIGLASELLASAAALALAVALYLLLEGVGRGLALVALVWRVAEATALGLTALFGLLALRALGGMSAFEPAQAQAVAGLLLQAHGGGYAVAMTFFGLGSTVYAYQLLRSGFVPALLAAWGILASLAALAGGLAIVAYPAGFSMLLFAPVFVYELLLGSLLLLRGARIEEPTPGPAALGQAA